MSKHSGTMVYKTEVKRSRKELRKGNLNRSESSKIGALISLSFAGFLVYFSLHYVGAFINIGKIVGVSSKTLDLDEGPQGARKLTSAISYRSEFKRIYLRGGQAISVEYALPEGASLDLSVLQCDQRPVLEVFKCKPVGERTVKIRQKAQGSSTIYVSEPGFYYFADKVTLADGERAKRGRSYQIVWRRS